MKKIKRIKKNIQDVVTYYFIKINYKNQKGYLRHFYTYQIEKKLKYATLSTNKNRINELKNRYYEYYSTTQLNKENYQEFYNSIKICQIESDQLNFKINDPYNIVIPTIHRLYPKLNVKQVFNPSKISVNTLLRYAMAGATLPQTDN